MAKTRVDCLKACAIRVRGQSPLHMLLRGHLAMSLAQKLRNRFSYRHAVMKALNDD